MEWVRAVECCACVLECVKGAVEDGSRIREGTGGGLVGGLCCGDMLG